MNDTKILIIEDNIVTLGDLEMRIGNMGYNQIETAVSGQEAIEIAHRFKPNLILSDINLGEGITGIEAVKKINQEQDIPVVYLTAYDDNKTLAQAGVTAPYAYLLKPLQERELEISLSIALHKHRLENDLKDSEALFKAVATQAHDAIVIIDSNDEVIFWNKAAQQMFGYKQEELIGKKMHPILAPDKYAERYKQAFKKFIETGKGDALNKTVELTALRKGQKEFPIELSLTGLKIKNKIHALAIIRDITQRKQAEAAIEQKNTELIEANATKDRFISILGHDLKSPFNSLLGFSDMLLRNIDKYDNEKIKQYAGFIYNSSKQTYNLLNNLLEWSRSRRNKIPFNPESLNLDYLMRESYLLLENSAKAKNIEIQINLTEKLKLTADSEMIKTVIRNLISNAIKFTPEYGKILVSSSKINNNVRIEVSDSGVGMNEKTVNSLFKIDKTQSTEGTNGERGTGFGLLLCKEFVDKHKGEISVESTVGKGSKFIITLPEIQNFNNFD